MKKLFTIFIFLFITMMIHAQTATAPSIGDGSLGNPYQIATLNNLYWIAYQTNHNWNQFSGQYFIQTVDIDASSTSTWFPNGSGGYFGWEPIFGNGASVWFKGSYDGQVHTISGLFINRLIENDIGFFGKIDGGTIKNLGLTNVSITGGGNSNGANVGGLTGYLVDGATIKNCYVSGSVSGYDGIGGLIGQDYGYSGANTVINCHSSCTVSVTNSEGGGLIGISLGSKVSNCYSTGSVLGSNAQNNGGFIGENNSTLSSCYATGASNGLFKIGGLIGENTNIVTNCYATGAVNGSGSINGGLMGYNRWIINNCYATGLVTGTGSNGGFVGANDTNGNISTNCFWNITVMAGYGQNSGTFSAVGKTPDQMQTASTYTGAGWPSSIWDIANSSYPGLWGFPSLSTTAITTYNAISATMGGNVTDNGGVFVTENGVVYSAIAVTPIIGGTGVTKDINGTGNGTFSKSITNLSPNTRYYICAYATNSVGTNYGSVVSFVTLGAPTITGISPTSGPTVGGTSVTITGTNLTSATVVNFGSNAATITSNTSTSITATSPSGTVGTVHVTVTTAGSTSATSSADQFSYVAAPTATTTAASLITATGATLNGSSNPNGAATTGWFRYSTTNPGSGSDGFGTRVPAIDGTGTALGSGSSAVAYSQSITGLNPATTYYFSTNASNSIGTYFGSILNFTTQNAITSINLTGSSPTNASTVQYTVTFAAAVTGLSTSNFSLTTTGSVAGSSIGSISGSGITYTVTVNTGTGDGTIGLNLANVSGVSPTVGTTLPFEGQAYTIDKTPPTMISAPYPDRINYTTGQPIDFTVNFSEPVIVNTGSGTARLALSIASGTVYANYLSGSGTSSIVYRYTVASGDANGNGNISEYISINNGVNDYADLAGNNAAYDAQTFTLSGTMINVVPPTVTTQAVSVIDVTSATGNGNITNLGVQNPSQYGVVWSTSANPTTALSTKTTQGTAASTGAFTSSITGLTAYTPYHVRAYATNSTGTSYGADVTFTTSSAASTISGTGNWSTIAQWDNGIPGSSSNVTIGTGTVTVNGNYSVNNATINSTGAVNINTGNSLTVNGNLTLKSDATNTTSLILNGGSLNVTGTITVERYMVANKWYIISPTAWGQSVIIFLSANTNIPVNSSSQRAMQEYVTSSNSWSSYFTSSTPGTMYAGKGYATRISTTGVVDFVGTLTSGNKDVAVTRTGDLGWNCIGNPYTSAININTAADPTNNFLTYNVNNLDPSYAAIYIWDEYDVNNGSQNYYKTISNVGFTSTHTALGQNQIQVGQGFLVKAKATPSVVSFTPAMQVHQNSLLLKTSNVSWPSVELNVKTDSLTAYTAIAYNDQMTLGLDPSYDAGLLRGNNKLNVYSHLVNDNGVDFTIQCLPDKQMEKQVVPIGIDYLKGGEVKISAQVTGLPSGMNVILEDRVLKSFTTLNSSDEFKVTVDPNTKGIGRFYLHTTALSANDLKTVTLTGKLNAYFSSDNEIRIIGEVSSKAIATLYDAQGKTILIQKLQESNLNVIPTSNIKTGIYMLSVRDTGKLQSFKLFIKQ